MIRFCDQEVCCVQEDEFDRQQIIEYFLNGHRNEAVCVLDKEGKFIGNIMYSFILGRELQEAISKEYMVLGETTWEEARKCFERCPVEFGGVAMIPVVDKDRNLLCFAYQDDEANRELRMLKELIENKSALGFTDIYPQYEQVTVHGCNELAYQFVIYLDKTGVPVTVTGELWKSLLNRNFRGGEKCETLEYNDFEIYAEGIEPKEERIELRQSVSAEFEIVDKIYEKNILQGIFKDAELSLEEILNIFREKPVAILSTGETSVNAYDLLLNYGIDICCFVTGNINANKSILFGKPVLGRSEAEAKWRDIIFIDADAKNSAWGFGQTDMCSYLGFKRNQRFFLLRDYIEIPSYGFMNIMKHRLKKSAGRIILIGDFWLCMRMQRVLEIMPEYYGQILYCDILEENQYKVGVLKQIDICEIQSGDFCLLLVPKYYGCSFNYDGTSTYQQKRLDEYKRRLEKCKIIDMVEYSFEDIKFLDCMKKNKTASDDKKFLFAPDKIFLAEINSHSGNVFFEQILEGHPNIIKLPYSYLCSNLYSLCIRLEMEKKEKILSTFWKLYSDENKYFKGGEQPEEKMFTNKDIFNKTMSDFLKKKESFTSWELFVIIHISFAKMQGINIDNISKTIIYWQPHYANPRERYAEWLDKTGSNGFIINIVRNAYKRAGSVLNHLNGIDNDAIIKFTVTFRYPNEEKKKFSNWKRIVLKFENLKSHPNDTLKLFCKKVEMEWSDNLLELKSANGNETIFRMDSVYNTWEQYLSVFDRFRICLITGPWQKQYGYPYVRSLDFSRRELQEIFTKKLRYESEWIFTNEDTELRYLQWRRKVIGEWLWKIRKREILGESGDGVEQYEILEDIGSVNL